MKSAIVLLQIYALATASAFEGGYSRPADTFALDELPLRGTLVKAAGPGRLHFYLPRAHEIFDAEDGKTKYSTSKRSRRIASSSLYYSEDGKNWNLGGEGLHFTSVWTHPVSGRYFATIAGISYETVQGQLFKQPVYHVASSEDGKLWASIQGSMEPQVRKPEFFQDPENADRVCLFFHGMDILGARWSVAQPEDGEYAGWKLFHSQTWQHDVPR